MAAWSVSGGTTIRLAMFAATTTVTTVTIGAVTYLSARLLEDRYNSGQDREMQERYNYGTENTTEAAPPFR